ncbi:phosphoglucomutase [Sporosarcina sp. P26b]|uniref:phospho-sugar mutase n=1 Tax=Sporosarcina sp. P26b TaxID=2048253 RepID=UPI000C171C8A|nr:phospho-sugar mutase [Sporosarcina sp. P26b]PIC95686.1 phosphoglucomutase [Sporosarcina sp. P26b]
MQWKIKAQEWLAQLTDEDPMKLELTELLQNEQQAEDCFYKDLEFGTGGMRGVMGPGTNRLNIYTVRKVALGLAQYVAKQGKSAMKRGVVISYDSRHLSEEFALEMAKVIGGQGVTAYLFDALRPTPLLSFAVRHLQAFAGVMITASHNPPEYNGLKVYGEDGAQLPPEAADVIIEYIEKSGSDLIQDTVNTKQLQSQGLLVYIGDAVNQAYIKELQTIRINKEVNDVSIVFTALHGTASKPMQQAFESFGFDNVQYVKEQEQPDPNFSTVKSPNPEEAGAFELAIQYGEEDGADLLLATDPDADRLGVAVRDEQQQFKLLTGNQIGTVILNYLLEEKLKAGELPRNSTVMKTIVSTDIVSAMTSKYHIETVNVLTGFKFIAEKIHDYEKSKERSFLFGFEESYGYLIGDFVRDKDAIQTAVFMAEIAAVYKARGKTIYQVLQEIYEEYGYYKEQTVSITLEGKNGAGQITNIMDSFRNTVPTNISNINIQRIEDYQSSEAIDCSTGMKTKIDLPTSNVLKYTLENDSWLVIRPSGTEPKCKFYFATKGQSEQEATENLQMISDSVLNMVNTEILQKV